MSLRAGAPTTDIAFAADNGLGTEIDLADLDFEIDVDALDIDELIGRHLAAGELSVPSFPSILGALNGALAKGGDVAGVLAADAAFAQAVKRIGDSSSLPAAIERLGTKRVSRIAVACALAKPALAPGPLLDLRKRTWRESVASWLVAEALAEGYSVSADVAHLTALLHDYGKIIAIACVEKALAGSDAPEPHVLHVVEQHHCDVGAYIAEMWGLPEPIPSVIAGHHQTLIGRIALLDLMHTCDAVVDALGDRTELSLEELTDLGEVESREEAALIARGIDRLPQMLSAIADAAAPPPAMSSELSVVTPTPLAMSQPPSVATLLVNPARVNLPTSVVGKNKPHSGLVTIAVARTGLAICTPEPLAQGYVTHIELEGPRGPFRIWVTILCTRRHGALYIAEAKPLSLRGSSAEQWYSFVDQFRLS